MDQQPTDEVVKAYAQHIYLDVDGPNGTWNVPALRDYYRREYQKHLEWLRRWNKREVVAA